MMDRETNAYETYENTATALSEVASPVKRKLDELDKQLGELGELTHILIQRISLARRAADSAQKHRRAQDGHLPEKGQYIVQETDQTSQLSEPRQRPDY